VSWRATRLVKPNPVVLTALSRFWTSCERTTFRLAPLEEHTPLSSLIARLQHCNIRQILSSFVLLAFVVAPHIHVVIRSAGGDWN
jgi:hypothetical protein